MRIAFGTDESTDLTEHCKTRLAELGHDVVVVGEGDPWPDVGRWVGQSVAEGDSQMGVVCCHTGTGVSISANKVFGARAALCTDAATAAGARQWNDANVLAFGLRLTSETVLDEMLDAFLSVEVDDAELENIAKLEPDVPDHDDHDDHDNGA